MGGRGFSADCDGLRDLADDIDNVAGALENLDDTVGDDLTYAGCGGRVPVLLGSYQENYPQPGDLMRRYPAPALHDLVGNWVTAREELVGNLGVLANFLRGAADGYEDTDGELARVAEDAVAARVAPP